MNPKPIRWVASSLDDLREMPDEVKREIGFALDMAQRGGKHPNAKPLKGFKGGSVIEIVSDDDGNTYRAIYTIQFPDAIYVIHAFMKKSKSGISTPKHIVDLVKQRLKTAKDDSAERAAKRKKGNKKNGKK